MTSKAMQRTMFMKFLFLLDGSADGLKFEKGTAEFKILEDVNFQKLLIKVKIATARYGTESECFYLVFRVNPRTIKEQEKEITAAFKALGGLPKGSEKLCRACGKKLFGFGVLVQNGVYHPHCLRVQRRKEELLAKYPNVPFDVVVGLERTWHLAKDGVDKLSSPYCVVFFDKKEDYYCPEACKTFKEVMNAIAQNQKARNDWQLHSVYKKASVLAID